MTPSDDTRPLTPKQLRFCQEYITDLNSTGRELIENCRRVTIAWLLRQHGRPTSLKPATLRFREGETVFEASARPGAQRRGVRWWLECPGCGNRCGVRYSPWSFDLPDFRCRTCWDFGYASQLG
jgi:hypothetical protein